jgi:hypothetical protein
MRRFSPFATLEMIHWPPRPKPGCGKETRICSHSPLIMKPSPASSVRVDHTTMIIHAPLRPTFPLVLCVKWNLTPPVLAVPGSSSQTDSFRDLRGSKAFRTRARQKFSGHPLLMVKSSAKLCNSSVLSSCRLSTVGFNVNVTFPGVEI